MYSNRNFGSITYAVLFTTLMLIAFGEFAGIILYCLYTNYLHKIERVYHLIMGIKDIIYKFVVRNKDDEILDDYEQYQEELLAIDHLH